MNRRDAKRAKKGNLFTDKSNQVFVFVLLGALGVLAVKSFLTKELCAHST